MRTMYSLVSVYHTYLVRTEKKIDSVLSHCHSLTDTYIFFCNSLQSICNHSTDKYIPRVFR